MSDEPTWSVVQFVDDHTVEAVPTGWIQGDWCHWPALASEKLMNAIRKSEPLNTCWASYRIKMFRNAVFSDYTKARNKARIAEETSDLASEVEVDAKKRKRTLKKVFSSSSEEELLELNIPKPPSITKILKSKENKQMEKENSYSDIGTNSALITYQTHQPHHPPDVEPAALICGSCKEKDKNLKTIMEQNHLLRSLTQDILTEVKAIKEEIRGISRTPQEFTSVYNKFPFLQFPLNSEEDLNKYDETLKDEDNFCEWVGELAKMGGSSCYNYVKRVMHSLLTNELALNYSWLGRKSKKPFFQMNTVKLIVCAADKSQISKNKKETEGSIQLWLRMAGDRMLCAQNKKKL